MHCKANGGERKEMKINTYVTSMSEILRPVQMKLGRLVTHMYTRGHTGTLDMHSKPGKSALCVELLHRSAEDLAQTHSAQRRSHRYPGWPGTTTHSPLHTFFNQKENHNNTRIFWWTGDLCYALWDGTSQSAIPPTLVCNIQLAPTPDAKYMRNVPYWAFW